MPRTHHKSLGPSSVPAIMQCACYVPRTESDAGVDTDREYASDGTIMHAYGANVVLEKIGQPVLPFDPETIPQENSEDVDYMVGEALAFIEDNCPGTPIEVEKQVEIMDDEMKTITYGTRDIGTRNDKIVVVLDWKSGLDWNPMGHDYKPQLATYALADMRRHKVGKALCIEAYFKPRKFKHYFITLLVQITCFNF